VDPLSTRQLNRAIHAAAEEAHLGKRVSMHTLRHYLPFRTMSGNPQMTWISRAIQAFG
jgi:integrase/recombinase XerD